MIHREATIRWKGYDPDELSRSSGKRVWCNCELCGNGRWLRKCHHSDICRNCASTLSMTIEVKNKISESLIGHDVTQTTRDKIAYTLIGYKHTEKAKKNMTDSKIGHDTSQMTSDKISNSVKIAYKEYPKTHKDAIDNMCGGNDIVDHHYIYDHSDISKFTMKMTRSHHTWLHHLLRRANINMLHINIQDVL